MRGRRGEVKRICSVLATADYDEPLTAREILDLLAEHGEEFDSAHRVATVLGREAATGEVEVEVIREQPYRYRVADGG